MRSLLLIAFIIFFFLLHYQIVNAQICDENLVSIEDSKFAYKKRDNRCEGFYRAKVASASLEVVGLLSGKLNYDLVDGEVVKLSTAIPADKTIYIRAQAFPIKTYYRMDGLIEPSQVFKWPVKDILLPKNLSSNKIGVSGWYMNSAEPIYIPLKANAKINKILNDDKIRAFFRANVDVWVYYKWYSFDDKKWTDWNKLERIYRSGSPIIITLQTAQKGLCKLLVSAKVLHTEDEWIERSIHIYLGR